MSLIKKILSVLAASVMGVNLAQAALPAGVAAGFTSLQTDGLALIDLAWPVVVAFTVAFILISLFKRSASAVG